MAAVHGDAWRNWVTRLGEESRADGSTGLYDASAWAGSQHQQHQHQTSASGVGLRRRSDAAGTTRRRELGAAIMDARRKSKSCSSEYPPHTRSVPALEPRFNHTFTRRPGAAGERRLEDSAATEAAAAAPVVAAAPAQSLVAAPQEAALATVSNGRRAALRNWARKAKARGLRLRRSSTSSSAPGTSIPEPQVKKSKS